MASILPYEVMKWEMLFWFLKFLIPKLIIVDPQQDALDELLNSVDLSTYGLERVKLNANIGLDASETELDPQNPNPRGAYDDDHEKDPLDTIINNFNQRWFQDWKATPDEKRVIMVNFAKSFEEHPDAKAQYFDNTDTINKEIAFQNIFNEIMAKRRKSELDLYRLISQDEAFRLALQDSLKRMLRL